jgi:hypothetical protein
LGEENQLKNKTHNLKTKRVKKQKDWNCVINLLFIISN